MTGEIPRPNNETSGYTPRFNFDAMSIEEVVALVSVIENAREPRDPLDTINTPTLRMKEALTEDLSRYPDVNFERSMALFEALHSSGDSKVRSKASFAIGGLLRASVERTTSGAQYWIDKHSHHAAHFCLELLLNEDGEVGSDALHSLTDDIRRGKLPAEATAFLFSIIAGELQLVHDGEAEPRYLARQRQGDAPGSGPV
jgi:hypothetical protein